MAAALVMVEMMKHCVVGGMDLQFCSAWFWIVIEFVCSERNTVTSYFFSLSLTICMFVIVVAHRVMFCLYLVQLQVSFPTLTAMFHSIAVLGCRGILWSLACSTLTRDWWRLRLQLLDSLLLAILVTRSRRWRMILLTLLVGLPMMPSSWTWQEHATSSWLLSTIRARRWNPTLRRFQQWFWQSPVPSATLLPSLSSSTPTMTSRQIMVCLGWFAKFPHWNCCNLLVQSFPIGDVAFQLHHPRDGQGGHREWRQGLHW